MRGLTTFLVSVAAVVIIADEPNRNFARFALTDSIAQIEDKFGSDVDTSLEGYDHVLANELLSKRAPTESEIKAVKAALGPDIDYSMGDLIPDEADDYVDDDDEEEEEEDDNDHEEDSDISKRSAIEVTAEEVAAAKAALGPDVDYSLDGFQADDSDEVGGDLKRIIQKRMPESVEALQIPEDEDEVADYYNNNPYEEDDDSTILKRAVGKISQEELAAAKAALGPGIDYSLRGMDLPEDEDDDDANDAENIVQKRTASSEEIAQAKAALGPDVDYSLEEESIDEDEEEDYDDDEEEEDITDVENGPLEARDSPIGAQGGDDIGIGADMNQMFRNLRSQVRPGDDSEPPVTRKADRKGSVRGSASTPTKRPNKLRTVNDRSYATESKRSGLIARAFSAVRRAIV